MKSISEDNQEVDKDARNSVFDWELIKYGLGIVVLFGFVYLVHVLIHMW